MSALVGAVTLTAVGQPVRELTAAFGIGRATAYRYLAAVESGATHIPSVETDQCQRRLGAVLTVPLWNDHGGAIRHWCCRYPILAMMVVCITSLPTNGPPAARVAGSALRPRRGEESSGHHDQ